MQNMIDGLFNWRETKTTSPSNKHLGIYRSIILAYKLKMKSDKEQVNKDINDNNTHFIPLEEKILIIQNKLLKLAINHSHSYKRWQVVHNFFMEKIPGHPLISKLRIIHLYEAGTSY